MSLVKAPRYAAPMALATREGPQHGIGRNVTNATILVGDGKLRRLSARERQIAGLLVAGYSPENIAAQFGLTISTVRTYIRRIYGKLRVFSRIELARMLFVSNETS
jgi:DNA-binding CsgD family transcriptional regulator